VAYAQMHEGVQVLQADLKTPAGQHLLHRELAGADVLLTSLRASAQAKLGLGWIEMHARHQALSHVANVGAPGERAEAPGHDLTYLAEHDLVPGTRLPPTLYADMGGSLLASEAVLQAALRKRDAGAGASPPEGLYVEVPLSRAAAWLGLPRHWGLTQPDGPVGGAHAGYRVYPCRDGRVAVAALEPHFARRLCEAVGVPAEMMAPATREAVAAFFASRSRQEIDLLARERDLPLHTME
jgi:crotonobetainyl-CoA:carnitine CoA-transferase CaiB-like acyl-CoA transferase